MVWTSFFVIILLKTSKMKSKFFTLLLGFLIIPSVVGWGKLGHLLTGYIAQNLLNPEVAQYIANLIQDPAYHGQLTDLAPWADYVANDHNGVPAKYPWSKELHFADTHDTPPKTCHLDYVCILSDENLSVVRYFQYLQCLPSSNGPKKIIA